MTPEFVNICGVLYEVEYFDDASEELWGQCDYVKRKIKVYNGKGTSKFDVLAVKVHEMTHAILYEQGHWLRKLLGEDEESFVHDFSAAFMDTMVRNRIIKIKG